jgi:excisionase family DNA binding protein
VANLLVTCERTVRRWIDLKKLIAHRFGSATRIASEELADFITRARSGPMPLQPLSPLDGSFYTAGQVAEILNVCIRTVRRRIKGKALIAHQFGRLVRIGADDLQDFMSRSRRD